MADLGFDYDLNEEQPNATRTALIDTETYRDKFIQTEEINRTAHLIDDSLTAEQKLNTYSQHNDPILKMWFIKNFVSLLQQASLSNPHLQLSDFSQPFLERIAICLYDATNFQLFLCVLEELEGILKFCIINSITLDHFMSVLLHIFLVVCCDSKRDQFKEVLGKCCIHNEDILQLLCKSIVQICTPSLSNSTAFNTYRTESLDFPISQLLQEIAHCIHPSYMDDFLLNYLHYLTMYQATNESILVNVVAVLEGLFKNERFSLDDINRCRLFELYCRLSSNAHCLIRKCCCCTLPAVSQKLAFNTKRKDVLSLYSAFLSDESESVQLAAKCNIGPLVASYYNEEDVPIVFIDRILELCPSIFGATRYPAAILEQLSFYFPGIVATFGSNHWQKLRIVLQRLSKMLNAKVSRALAFGMHEIGKIIGTAASQEDLYPIFKDFLNSKEDAKYGVLCNLKSILQCFSSDFLTAKFDEIINSAMFALEESFTMREIFVRQLGQMANIFVTENQQSRLLMHLAIFSCDKIGIVRESAIDGMIRFLSDISGRLKIAVPVVQSLSSSKSKRAPVAVERIINSFKYFRDKI